MLQGASQLNAKLVQLEKRFDGIAKQVALESVPDVEKAVRGDIGDNSLSHWTRSKPIPIVGSAQPVGPGVYEVTPSVMSRGPMRVLHSGRNAYAVGDRRTAGTYTSKKTGLTTARTKRVRGFGKGHAGKGTWSDAEQLVQQGLGRRSAQALHQVMAKTFRGS